MIEQYPLMQRSALSQQSAAVVHRSCGIEQFVFGGAVEHTRPPSALGSQYPPQHWSPLMHDWPSGRQGAIVQYPRELPAWSSWPGR
jgi:hypothetical protein